MDHVFRREAVSRFFPPASPSPTSGTTIPPSSRRPRPRSTPSSTRATSTGPSRWSLWPRRSERSPRRGSPPASSPTAAPRWSTGRSSSRASSRAGRGIVAFTGAFHGRTLGAVSLTTSNVKYRRRTHPLLPAVYHADFPYCFRCPASRNRDACGLECRADLERIFRTVIPRRRSRPSSSNRSRAKAATSPRRRNT